MRQFAFMNNYHKTLSGLPDDVRLRLYDAIMAYMFDDVTPELEPLEMAVFQALSPSLDRSKRLGENGSNKIKENQTESNDIKSNHTESKKIKKNHFAEERSKEDRSIEDRKEKRRREKGEENNPLTPLKGETASTMIADRGFPVDVSDAVSDWVKYKIEKRQGYKPTGLKSFLTEVQKHLEKNGSQAVIDVIRQSMSQNYQGVTWDKLKNARSGTTFDPTEYLLGQIGG